MNCLKRTKAFFLLGIITLLCCCFSFTVSVHRFYLSLSEVHCNTKKHSLNVSCKLFTEDLETALSKSSGKKIKLTATSSSKEINNLLATYLNNNFKINIGGQLLKLTYIGFEIEDDAIWCYLETTNFKGKGKVAVYDSLLYDDFPDQSNMVNFYWNEVSKSAKLSNPEKMVMFAF
jgi:hypothetical protein